MNTRKYGHTSPVSFRRRLKLAWHVLRDRPLAFRLNFEDGSIVAGENTHIQSCTFIGGSVKLPTFQSPYMNWGR
jgi:hypothetical protein